MRHVAAHPDDAEQGHRRAGHAKLLRLAELYGGTVDGFLTDGHRARAHDEHSRIRGSEPAGRGWGF